jgi:hypothetical protein
MPIYRIYRLGWAGRASAPYAAGGIPGVRM